MMETTYTPQGDGNPTKLLLSTSSKETTYPPQGDGNSQSWVNVLTLVTEAIHTPQGDGNPFIFAPQLGQ